MSMNSKFSVLTLLGLLVMPSAFAAEKPAAVVNGQPIPEARVELRVKVVTSQGQTDTPELRKAIREDLINLEVMAQEAVKSGLEKTPEVIQEIELAKQSVLASSFIQNYAMNHPVSEEQLKDEYNKLKNKLGNKEYSASHILVETEAEAKSIIAQLGKKAKFEKLAEKSMDTGSAEQGGSLGWAVPSNFVPEFSSALLKLKKGEYTKEPVKTQYGWHIIKLDDVRDLSIPPYAELKPQLQQRLQQQAVQAEINRLREKAKIE